MTQNQIAYWALQEQKRSNREREGLTRMDVREKMRSNLAQEGIKGTEIEQRDSHFKSKNWHEAYKNILGPFAQFFGAFTRFVK